MNTLTVSDEKLRRLEQIIEAATGVFAARGYRRTTMADIAREMGVAPGTLYLYVVSKEALFDLAVRWHLGYVDSSSQLQLPVEAPGLDSTLAFLEQYMRADILTPGLLRALDTGAPPDAAAELESVLNELYDMMARYRGGIRLVERSALDWPELDNLFEGLRRDLMARLGAYIQKRADSGAFYSVGNTRAVARFIMEYVGSFSMRQLEDLRPTVTAEEGRHVCINMLMRALLP